LIDPTAALVTEPPVRKSMASALEIVPLFWIVQDPPGA
jgi:hypothetical protein